MKWYVDQAKDPEVKKVLKEYFEVELDKHITDVVFKMHAEKTCVAFFINSRQFEKELIGSYMHVGQHGDSSDEFMLDCIPATEEQYRDLLVELTNLGYLLRVVKQ